MSVELITLQSALLFKKNIMLNVNLKQVLSMQCSALVAF